MDWSRWPWSREPSAEELTEQLDRLIHEDYSGAGRVSLTILQSCDGCERYMADCASVGEEVLCADCLLARATEFGDEVKSLISSWREEAAGPAVEPGRSNALSSAAAELQERFDPTETSGGGE